ncbi:MAG TPA: diguanylate cyclase, partial [Myxococcales bacterium]|nr:diguanylate cyclase [Myxococcales bacterium]
MVGTILLTALVALGAPQGRFAFRSYGSEQGLENLSVVAILQDAEGYLWVATEDGLYRYDGDRFHRYDVEDGLPSYDITSLALGADGRVAVGTFRGVARFADGRFHALAAEGLADVIINSLAAAPDGALWVATGAGIFVEQHGRFVPAAGWPEGTGASSVWADSRGIVAASYGADIWSLHGGSWRRIDVPGERVDMVARDRRGTIWARSRRHLWSIAEGEAAPQDLSPLLPGASDTGYLWLDQRGTLWVPTDSGLLSRDDEGNWSVLGPQQGLPSSWARAAAQDREGSVWIAATGLHRLVGRGLWRVYSTREGLPSEVVWAEWRDAAGRLYVGTDKGLARAVSATDRFELVGGTEGHAIRTIAQSADGALWMGGSPPEILRVDAAGKVRRYGAAEGVTGEKILTLLATGRGELLVGTYSGGILRLDGDRFVQVQVPGGSVRERFSQIVEDREGRIWAAGELGLLVRSRGEWQRFGTQDGLRDERISYVLERRSGDICAAYFESKGFSCFLPAEHGLRGMQHFDSSNALSNNRVYQLGEDRNGRLWVGTGQGADVIDARGVEHFGEARGMAGDDCDATAFLADADGDVWIGTSTGLGRFIGGNYLGPPEPPRAVVVQSRLNEKDSTLEVHFAGLSFLDEARVQHQVRLLPLEGDFRQASVREARYSALPPGRYTFEVRARLPPGPWSAPARLEFTLMPQWWQTAWFRLLMVAVAGASVLFIANWRVRRLAAKNRELEQTVSSRTGELAAANQALRDLSVSDPLTGLKNRRYLELAMPETIASVLRSQHGPRAAKSGDLLLAVIDLDDFKQINDTFGHGAGDRVLQQAGKLVAQTCRESDSAVRWGGEEFVIVARDTDRGSAGAFAERVCELFRRAAFEVADGHTAISITCSVGVAPFPLGDLTWSEVVEMADRGLYAAKRAGKNCWALVEAGPTHAPMRRREFEQLLSEGVLELTVSRRPAALRAVD